MARILVTGASGFVGRAIADDLAAHGHEVVGTVNSRPGRPGDVAVDVRDRTAFEAIPAGRFDVVVHSAALLGPERFDRRTRDVNVKGTENALDFARSRGATHFIQIGSIAAYGSRCVGQDRDESTRLSWFAWNPMETEYMRSKATAERRIARSGVPYTTLRLPVVIGRGSSFSAPAMRSLVADGIAPFVVRNDRLVSVVCVANACSAVRAVVEAGPRDRAYNVCDHHLPWNELVENFARELGREARWTKRGFGHFVRELGDPHAMFWLSNGWLGAHFPSEAFERDLPWTRTTTLAQAIAEEIAGIRTTLAA